MTQFKPQEGEAREEKRYRCVYCKQGCRDLHSMISHSAVCPARQVVIDSWNYEYRRALEREARGLRGQP